MPFEKINLLLKLKQFGCFRVTGNSQEDVHFEFFPSYQKLFTGSSWSLSFAAGTLA